MMEVVFRQRAVEDLHKITTWYENVAPASLGRILADITRSIDQLRHFPQSGTAVHGRSYRRIVTLKYHFKVSYRIEHGHIVIIGIYRYQNRKR